MADATAKIVIEAKDNASGVLNNVKGSSNQLTDSFKKVGLGMTAMGVAGAVAIKGFAQSFGEMEQVQVAFSVMMGSAEAGQKKLEELWAFAKKTPFTIPGVETAAKQLLAYGVKSEALIKTMTTLGNIAAGVGADKFPQLTLAYGQVQAATILTSAELRQFSEAGVPLLDELARHFDTTTASVKSMVQDGAVKFSDVQAALENLTGEGGRFNNMMSLQSLTLLGVYSNLQDSITLLGRTMGEPLKKPLLEMMDIIIKVTVVIGDWLKQNPAIAEMAARVLLVGTAFALIAGPILIVIGFLPTLAAGFAMVGTVISAIGAPIAIAIAAMVALKLAWDTNFLGIRDVTAAAIEWLTEKFLFFKDEIFAIGERIKETYDQISADWAAFMTVYGEQVIGGLQLVKSYFDITWAAIVAAFRLVWEQIKIIFSVAWELLSGTIKTVLAVFVGDWSGAWTEIKDTFEDIWDGMKVYVENVMGVVMGMVTKFMEAINSAFNAAKNLFGLGESSKSSSSGSSSVRGKRASGGPVMGGAAYLVGEHGPEMFVPSQGGNISPNSRTGSGVTIIINGHVSSKEIAEEYGDILLQKLKLHSAVV